MVDIKKLPKPKPGSRWSLGRNAESAFDMLMGIPTRPIFPALPSRPQTGWREILVDNGDNTYTLWLQTPYFDKQLGNPMP